MLAVRSLEKQKKREEKQKRKLLKETFTLVESHVSPDAKGYLRNSHVPNQPLSMNECAVGSKSSSQLHVQGKDQGETHAEGHTECKHGIDVLQNQRPSEASLSDLMKFGTQDMLVQNPTVSKTTGDGMCSEAALLNVTTTHNPGDCCRGSEGRNEAHSEGSECGRDSEMVFAGGKGDHGTARADDVGSMQNESGWDSRAMAEAVATVALLSGRSREEIFQENSESVDD